MDLSHWGNTGKTTARFQMLKKAILSRRIITFTYVSSYGEKTYRQVLPARLVFKGQTWYLQAFCLEKQDYRTFRISRMLSLSITGRTFPTPLAPPPIQDTKSAPSIVSLRLRFSPAAAYRVYDEFDEHQIQILPDGTLEVLASFPEDGWVYGHLLSFGRSVEILSPERVKIQVGLLAKEIWEKSGKPDAGCQGFRGTIGVSRTKEDAAMNENPFCQSCGMPLSDPALRGREADGTPSPHYCKYCYDKGAFLQDMTMEEMIAFCAPIMAKEDPNMTEQAAREQMQKFFPILLRWRANKV